ncbi:flagellar basal body-associated FliL family protein [Tabrizicola sp.]|uniref:flagellar basal body-associated FliL family protein n=1 Tax=Tabrizicola sp. TaxID=2005166 RepID=UPI003F36A683
MMGKLLPILLAVVGLGGGVGAGLFLRPAAPAAENAEAGHDGDHAAEPEHAEAEEHSEDDDHAESGPDYVKMNNQFVVPVVEEGRVAAMVVLSLSLEVEAGNTEAVYQREPKLRDAFLQVLFDHANIGGFSGSFTDGSNLVVLRTSLKEAAAMILGTVVNDVLITDIARQDS